MRARLVRPEFWTDSTMGNMSDSTRLFYIGLWCVADDAGYLEWDLDAIGHSLLGYRSPSVRKRVSEAAAQTLLETGRLQLLECGRHAVIPTLERHRIFGGKTNERIRKAHEQHAFQGRYVPTHNRYAVGTERSSSESLSESESVRLSLSPPGRANGSKNPTKRTTTPTHVSALLPIAAKGES